MHAGEEHSRTQTRHIRATVGGPDQYDVLLQTLIPPDSVVYREVGGRREEQDHLLSG